MPPLCASESPRSFGIKLDPMPCTGVTPGSYLRVQNAKRQPSFFFFHRVQSSDIHVPSKLRNASCLSKRQSERKEVSFICKCVRKMTFCSQEMSVHVNRRQCVHWPSLVPPYFRPKWYHFLIYHFLMTLIPRACSAARQEAPLIPQRITIDNVKAKIQTRKAS